MSYATGTAPPGCPAIGPENFGCLPGTHSQEHACPVWANPCNTVVYQAGWGGYVNIRGAILNVTSQILILRYESYIVVL